MVVVLVLAIGVAAAPAHRSAPAVPVAFGCNDPQIGAYVDSFYTCEDCEITGMEGASMGVWYSWHCRYDGSLYRLYAT